MEKIMSKINDKLYRIFTEAKNVEWLKDLAVANFGGCTFIDAGGVWLGGKEQTIIIETVNQDERQVKKFVREICRYNDQESVLIQIIPCIYEFVSLPETKKEGGDNLYGL